MSTSLQSICEKPELFALICQSLNYQDLNQLCQVSKLFKQYVYDFVNGHTNLSSKQVGKKLLGHNTVELGFLVYNSKLWKSFAKKVETDQLERATTHIERLNITPV